MAKNESRIKPEFNFLQKIIQANKKPAHAGDVSAFRVTVKTTLRISNCGLRLFNDALNQLRIPAIDFFAGSVTPI
jgi:hypothetical protein